jgi:hypothetical protein
LGGAAITANVSHELIEQLDRAGSQPVQAIFQMQSPGEPGKKLSAHDAVTLAEQAVGRVAGRLGREPLRRNLLRNVGVLILEADPEFIRALIEQPEIRSASPNKTAESPLIPPKGKRPV